MYRVKYCAITRNGIAVIISFELIKLCDDLRVYLIKTICVVQFYVHSFWLCNGTLSYFVLTMVRLIIIIIMNPNEHLRQTILKKSI